MARRFPDTESEVRLVVDRGHAERVLRVIRRKAGPAERNRASVEDDLGDAMESLGAMSGPTQLADIARLAGRVRYKADQLLAADKIPDAIRCVDEASRAVDKARAAR
jgi:hypothetical protein